MATDPTATTADEFTVLEPTAEEPAAEEPAASKPPPTRLMASESEIIALAHSDIGKVKASNEDSYLLDKRLHLYIVADGMGGHAAGEVASDLAVRVIGRHVREHEPIVTGFDGSTEQRDAIKRLLEVSVRLACKSIYEQAQADPSKRGMGTTVCLLQITPGRGFIAHVGDSRIYVIRQGEVFQLTEDHSLINELIKRGKLTPEAAANAPYKNAVTRAVGVYEDVQVDVLDFEIAPGDVFVVCSDGLTTHVADHEIGAIVQQQELLTVPKHLVELANARGGRDNITVVVVRLAGGAASDESELALRLNLLRRMPLFQHLSYIELVEVINISELWSYEAEEIVFLEGQEGDALFVVLEGEVSIEKGSTVLARLGEGGHFGEMALMDKRARSADARAATACRLIVVKRSALFGLMRRDKEVAVKLLWCFVQVLNNRLRTTSRNLRDAHQENLQLQDGLLDLEVM